MTAFRKQLPGESDDQDLGFGSVVASQSKERLLNRDGTFNVVREGLGVLESLNPYSFLVEISWMKFLLVLTASFLLVNLMFGVGYFGFGGQGLVYSSTSQPISSIAEAFFFSVQTFSTIGYGYVVPQGAWANILVTIESLVGLLWVALSTGLVFARFSRPSTRILYSENAVVAPYHDSTGFMFRVVNTGRTQLIEVAARVLFARFEEHHGRRIRRFHELTLERSRVMFFPLSWTIVHPIDESSPLWGLTHEDLVGADAEFLVLLSATDEIFSQNVFSRSSFHAHEIVWNARFGDIFNRDHDGSLRSIDLSRFHKVEKVQEGSPL